MQPWMIAMANSVVWNFKWDFKNGFGPIWFKCLAWRKEKIKELHFLSNPQRKEVLPNSTSGEEHLTYPLSERNYTMRWNNFWWSILGSMHLSLVQRIVSNFILQSLKTSKLRNFQTKNVSVAQRQSLLVSNYFQFLVQQCFYNSNLRHVLDYESILIIIKSNIPSIRPFFSALLCPSKLLFYVHTAPSSSGIWSVSPFFWLGRMVLFLVHHGV